MLAEEKEAKVEIINQTLAEDSLKLTAAEKKTRLLLFIHWMNTYLWAASTEITGIFGCHA